MPFFQWPPHSNPPTYALSVHCNTDPWYFFTNYADFDLDSTPLANGRPKKSTKLTEGAWITDTETTGNVLMPAEVYLQSRKLTDPTVRAQFINAALQYCASGFSHTTTNAYDVAGVQHNTQAEQFKYELSPTKWARDNIKVYVAENDKKTPIPKRGKHGWPEPLSDAQGIDRRLAVQIDIIRKKAQNQRFRDALLSTGDTPIFEDTAVSHMDDVFGIGPEGTGQNFVGKALMQVREELRIEADLRAKQGPNVSLPAIDAKTAAQAQVKTQAVIAKLKRLDDNVVIIAKDVIQLKGQHLDCIVKNTKNATTGTTYHNHDATQAYSILPELDAVCQKLNTTTSDIVGVRQLNLSQHVSTMPALVCSAFGVSGTLSTAKSSSPAAVSTPEAKVNNAQYKAIKDFYTQKVSAPAAPAIPDPAAPAPVLPEDTFKLKFTSVPGTSAVLAAEEEYTLEVVALPGGHTMIRADNDFLKKMRDAECAPTAEEAIQLEAYLLEISSDYLKAIAWDGQSDAPYTVTVPGESKDYTAAKTKALILAKEQRKAEIAPLSRTPSGLSGPPSSPGFVAGPVDDDDDDFEVTGGGLSGRRPSKTSPQ